MLLVIKTTDLRLTPIIATYMFGHRENSCEHRGATPVTFLFLFRRTRRSKEIVNSQLSPAIHQILNSFSLKKALGYSNFLYSYTQLSLVHG